MKSAGWLASGRLAWVLGIVFLALLIACARGDLWLDEVLSLQWAKCAKSPADLLILYRHDNNHLLNSLWLFWVLKIAPSELAYRSLSLVSGAVSLGLLWWIAGRLIPRARIVPLALLGSCYVFLVLSSEARGYAPAMALSLACFAILLRQGFALSAGWVVGFWCLSILAILAHATAIMPLAAMGCWGLYATRSLRKLAIWLLPAFAFFLFFAVFFLKEMMVAGGPETSPAEVLRSLAAYALGLPNHFPWNTLAAILGGAMLLAGAFFGRFEIPHVRVCLGLAALAFPAIAALAATGSYVHFRYAAVSLPFGALLLGGVAELAVRRNPGAARWVALCLALFLAMQIPRITALLVHGRASARLILEDMMSHGQGTGVVTSNHHMMVGIVLQHYRRMNPRYSRLQYAVETPPEPPDWLIVCSQDDPMQPPSEAFAAYGALYRLMRAYSSAPVSGGHWALYQKQGM